MLGLPWKVSELACWKDLMKELAGVTFLTKELVEEDKMLSMLNDLQASIKHKEETEGSLENEM